MEKKLIIFDLDGTLLDTIKDLNAASNYASVKNGYPKVTIEETKTFIGNGIKKLIERSLKGELELFELVFDDFKKYYYENVNVYTKPYDGILELLKKLKENNYELAVLSNKVQEALSLLCDSHFADMFSMVVGDRVDLERKPSIMGLKLICNELDYELKDVTYIGDSEVDVKTVINAGCHGIFVSYGFRSKEDLLSAGAEIICDNVCEVMKKLEV